MESHDDAEQLLTRYAWADALLYNDGGAPLAEEHGLPWAWWLRARARSQSWRG